jgi:hypothetical protein
MARDGYESRHTPETVLNSLSTSDADFGAIRALAPFARYGDDDEITACAVAVAAELTLDGDVDYEAAPHFFVSRARLRSVPRAVYARLLAQLRAAMSIPGTESAFETLIAMLLAQEPPTQREVEVPETPNPTYKRRARALYRRAPVMGMAFSFR